MTKYFMLDIETTGLKPTDSILQIGILECIKSSNGLYIPARSLNKILHFDEVVTDKWILTNHDALLKTCKTKEYESPTEVRAQILGFFKQCGIDKQAGIMGLNAGVFDLPFMHRVGYLKPEDHHYRIYELQGTYKLAADVLGIDSVELFLRADSAYDMDLGPDKKHDAMYDCMLQLKTLNGIIELLRK